ncbi:MAG: hypothetical protein U0990_06355 [Candidatus Nanopelagicales bacterium]|nr:hypothetical protein [Candidatus Nanopelagicales bacterium]
MAVKVDLKQPLEDIWGEKFKITLPDENGKQKTYSNVEEVLTLFLKNLANFHVRANNGKPMPWEWSEHCINIALVLRHADGVLELDNSDHKWLMERVKEFGTAFITADAAMMEKWLAPIKEEKPDLKLVKEQTGE